MQLVTLIAATAPSLVALGHPIDTQIRIEDGSALSFQYANGSRFGSKTVVYGAFIEALRKTNDTSPVDHVGYQSAPGEVAKALSRLRTIGQWGDNCDGEEGPAPDKTAVASATLMLGFLSSSLGIAPKVGLNADGQPSLTLFGEDLELAVTIPTASEISYFAAHGDEIRGGLADFDGTSLPTEMVAAIADIRHSVA